jgi:hypothetical protein
MKQKKEERMAQKIRILEKQLRVAKASARYMRVIAYNQLEKFSPKNYMGSAVLVTITNINTQSDERSIEFSVTDGLPTEAIEGLKKGILYSLELEESLHPTPKPTNNEVKPCTP